MKLRIRDRLLSALMGLVILVIALSALLYLLGLIPDWNGLYLSAFKVDWHRWLAEGICVLFMLIGICGIAVLFRRRKDKGVVVQHTEYGDMSISMKAMENMVNQTRISHSRGGICVDMKITLMNGINIPLTVNALQKQIKQYITSCSGVDVEEVRVMVETETAKRLPAPEVIETPAVVEVPAEPDNKPVEKATECLCQHQEEPDAYVETKVPEAVQETPEEVASIEVEAETIAEEQAEEIVAEEVSVPETEESSEEAEA